MSISTASTRRQLTVTKRWTEPRKYAKPRPRRTELGVRCVHVRVCHACVPALGHAKWTPKSSSRRNLRLIVINLGPPGAPKAAYTFEGDTNLIRAIGSSQIARFRSLSLFRSFASTRHAVPFCGHTCEATSNGYLGTVLGLHHDQTADPSHRGINAIHYVCRRCSYLCLYESEGSHFWA